MDKEVADGFVEEDDVSLLCFFHEFGGEEVNVVIGGTVVTVMTVSKVIGLGGGSVDVVRASMGQDAEDMV